eukprot:1158781-Pelagomonas_calceolata.AAC.10
MLGCIHTTLLLAQVDMSDTEDSFQAVASQCMNALVLGLNTRLDAALQVCNWACGRLSIKSSGLALAASSVRQALEDGGGIFISQAPQVSDVHRYPSTGS